MFCQGFQEQELRRRAAAADHPEARTVRVQAGEEAIRPV